MNNEELYERWKQEKQTIEIPREFCEELMSRIRREEGQKRPRVTAGEFFERIFARRLAKAAVFAGATVLGIIRMLLVLRAVLG